MAGLPMSLAVGLVLLVTGLMYFRNTERTFRHRLSMTVISVQNSEGIQTRRTNYDTLRDQITRSFAAAQRAVKKFWALRDVSFGCEQGTAWNCPSQWRGQIDLLKIISQITEPTEGEIRIRGASQVLLEVGTDFIPS